MSGFGEYECSLTGVVGESGMFEEEDGLGDLPIAWTQVTFQRRTLNPEWVILQRLKTVTLQQLLSQLPEASREEQEPYARFQVRMAFDAIEQRTPRYILDQDDVVHLSPQADVNEVLNEARQLLGLDDISAPAVLEEQDDEEGEGEDEDE